ncbi:hypothetical protein ANN_15277 [Periplaneta americana]|uniref:Uncharacterized protein n=1 Tax=Periplaneta americana TaxID=6978 RepID=A0ABQ8SHS7_PERAM|nr:hypothetical protein ANN_15277 [Periplaneta americana]
MPRSWKGDPMDDVSMYQLWKAKYLYDSTFDRYTDDKMFLPGRPAAFAHVGLAGNELADHLAKQAARNNEIPVSFDRIPVSDIMRELQEESVVKWESEWQNTKNGAVTKSFFPSVKERLRVNIPLNGKVTTFLTGHGKTGAYLYRFKLRDNPSCTCGAEEQTVDHLLFECPKLDKERLAFQREMLRKTGKWTFTKLKIMQEHAHTFTNYVNGINLDE